MLVYSIPDPETLRREIQTSHERCRQHGVNPDDPCNFLQNRLKPEELAFRLEQNREAFIRVPSRSTPLIGTTISIFF